MSTVKTNAAQIGQSLTATNNFTIYQPASPDATVRWGVGNSGSVTDIITLNSSGNVGIGTSSPGYKLHEASNTAGATNFVMSQNTAATGSAGFIAYASGANVNYYSTFGADSAGNTNVTGAISGTGSIIFTNIGTERLRINSSGYVGIGTPSPGATLDVAVDSTNYVKFRGRTSDNQVTLQFVNSTNSTQQAYIMADGNPQLMFGTASAERMRIGPTGYVSVGTTSPNSGATLTTYGSSGIRYDTSVAHAKTVEIVSASNAGPSNIIVTVTGGADAASYWVEIKLTAYIGMYANYTHTVYKANSWTSYGAAVVNSQLNSGTTVTPDLTIGNTLKYTVNNAGGFANPVVSVKVIAGGNGNPDPVIAVTYS